MLKKDLNHISTILQILVFCSFILLTLLVGGRPVQATMNNHFIKVIASKNVLENDGQQIILWHDYGSFALYLVQKDTWGKLPPELKAQAAPADEMDNLYLNDKTLNNQSQQYVLNQPDVIDLYDGNNLQLIQFVGPIKDEWLQAVESTGTTLVHYIANNGFLVWTDERGRNELHALVQDGDFLQSTIPLMPGLKLDTSLSNNQASQAEADQLVRVTIQILAHNEDSRSKSIISDLLVEQTQAWEPILNYQNAAGLVARKDIAQISRLPDVVWIGETFPKELNDEVQGRILAGSLNLSQTTPVGPGYLSWFSQLNLSTDPLDYPIVDVTDDGFGNGNAAAAGGDVTLRELGMANKPSRIEYIANCTSAATGAGPDGHGHLNISIAGGYDNRQGSPYRDEQGYQRGLGVNPFGRFASTRVFDSDFNLTGCGGSEQSLIKETYNRGARIISNSWSCRSCAGRYDDSSQAYDAAVRDADPSASGNQEVSIVFSAGNAGPSSNTIGSPGNGKNMITVGASESVRPTWIDGCGIGTDGADNVQDIANFSSRGPAPGDRIKPDVIAPGTHIQGTASTTPTYSGNAVCDKFQPTNQKAFAASSGTSHSAPAIAGEASLVHTFLRLNESIPDPSPALIKGFIIANTSYLTGKDAGDDLPSNNQGYGLPNMTNLFDNTARVLIDQGAEIIFTESGEEWSKTLSVANPNEPVRIVLAYTDYPGAIGTQPQVNDLNLSVKVDGQTYLGNHMNGAWSITGGTADKVNNVEAVFLPSVTDSALEIKVTAFNIAGDGVPNLGDQTDQDFALVCSNCIVQEDFTMTVSPQGSSICLPGSAEYTVKLGSIYNFADLITLSTSNVPQGLTTQFDPNPVSSPGQSRLKFSAGQSVAPGSFSININGQTATRQHSSLVNLQIFSKIPAQINLLAPANASFDQPLDVTFNWSSVEQAKNYELEIAADSNFENVIIHETALASTTFSPTGLESGHLYYWRVRANNSCGSGNYSNSNFFSTKLQPGSCPLGADSTILYQNNFEGGAEGWTSEGLNDTWTISSARTNSLNRAYYAQNLGKVSDQKLLTPPISLPIYEGPLTLQFWSYQELESNAQIGEVCFDGGILEISTNAGQTWTQLGGPPGDNSILTTDPYDGIVDSLHGNPLGGKAAWCGDPQDWINSVVNLEDYANQTIQFRFRLGTDESIDHEGWYIDDVIVQSCKVHSGSAYLPIMIKP